MNAIGRKQHIIQKLQKENYVDTNELAAELAVSAMTIRRDLNALAKSGLITVQHGGATLNSGSLFEFNMAMKNENQMTEKMRIAKNAWNMFTVVTLFTWTPALLSAAWPLC